MGIRGVRLVKSGGVAELSATRINVVKDIYIAILSTCALLLTLILGFVVPSMRDQPTIVATRYATVCFFAASACSLVGLYGIAQQEPDLSEKSDALLFITIGCVSVVLLFLAIAIWGIMPV